MTTLNLFTTAKQIDSALVITLRTMVTEEAYYGPDERDVMTTIYHRVNPLAMRLNDVKIPPTKRIWH